MGRLTHSPIAPILGALRSVPVSAKALHDEPKSIRPFITISREPGAGAVGVSHSFVDAMNADTPEEERWTCWDREIVEKIAADHRLSERVVDGLEERDHSFIANLLSSLSFADTKGNYDEERIYHEVKKMVLAVAESGNVVIVGRGGVFITRGMQGAIHVRLVSPLKQRVEFIARHFNLSEKTAAARIHEVEKNRRAFFKMHWPQYSLDPEMFALTINTAEVDTATIVQMLRALVQQRISQPKR